MTKPHTTDLSVDLQQISNEIFELTTLLNCASPLLSCLQAIYANKDESIIDIFNPDDLESMFGISTVNVLDALNKSIEVQDLVDTLLFVTQKVSDDASQNTESHITTHQ